MIASMRQATMTRTSLSASVAAVRFFFSFLDVFYYDMYFVIVVYLQGLILISMDRMKVN